MEKKIFRVRQLQRLIIPLLILLTASGCSTSTQETYSNSNVTHRADQTFSFYKNEDGKDIRWEVNFKDGELSSVFKDGEKIPDNEIDNNRDMIYDRLDKVRDQSHHITIDLSSFKLDMKKFIEDMRKMKEELKNYKYNFNFDNEDFKKGMEELSKELSGLKNKKIEIKFDTDKFRDEMEKLKRDINIDIHINNDDLEKNIDKLNDEIQNHKDELNHIDIDLSGLNEMMSNLNHHSRQTDDNLKQLDENLKKLNEFTNELKEELKKDNLIENKNDKLDLDLNENGMIVNGKKVTGDLYEKYKKMYEELFNKKLTDDNHFRIVE